MIEIAEPITERGRFELPESFPSPDFKSGAIDHSATSPGAFILYTVQSSLPQTEQERSNRNPPPVQREGGV